jgi:nitrite reductase (NADH) large subunit
MTQNTKKKKLVVIGNGMAGARVVEEILERDPNKFEITMFGSEPYGNYNRILLSNVLNKSQNPDDIFMNPLSWYQENNITLHAGVKVTQIDRNKKTVIGKEIPKEACPYTSGDSQFANQPTVQAEYDNIIIATGSRPFLPPIGGFNGPGCFMFRTLDECSHIEEYAKGRNRAVVIGGGLLGLEAARGLMTHGVQVFVLEAGPQLMKAQLDTEGGRLLKSTMEAMGVPVFLNKITTHIERKEDNSIHRLIFKDGYTLETNMVVMSAGIRPITEIAESSGLEVKRGIIVNDQMQTKDPAIFAVGECIEHQGQLYGLVEPIWAQARVLADVITATNLKSNYSGSKLGTKLKVMGVELASMGDVDPKNENDEVVVYREPRRGIYQKLIIRDNKLAGAILLGQSQSADTLMQLFNSEGSVPEKRTDLLFGESSANTLATAADLPDTAQICNCNGVTKEQIKDAILNQNCSSAGQVGQCTKAGKGCGSCKNLVVQLIEHYAGEVGYDASEHYYVPGIPLEKSQLISTIKEKQLKSVSAVFDTLAGGKEQAGSKVGLSSLLKSIWNEEYEDERDARFINDRVHANIQKNGTFSVVPRIYGGVTSADELIRIGTIAKKYNVPMVKITGGQRIDLLGVKKEDLPKMWEELGIPSGHAYTKAVRTVKSCVGTDFCRYGLGDAIKLAQEIEYTFQGIETPHKVKMAVAGCPRNCSEAMVKDIGVVAIEGGQWASGQRPETLDAPEGRWEIYIGGAAGGTVRKGDILCTLQGDHDEVIKIVGRFLQYYREHAKYLERTYGFVERIGIDRLKTILIDDDLGICNQLDAAIASSIKAYKDPWKEANLPKYPSQFEGPELVKILEEANNNG